MYFAKNRSSNLIIKCIFQDRSTEAIYIHIYLQIEFMYIYATVMHICTSMSLLIFLSVCQILFNTRQSMNNFGKIIYMLNISFFDFYFNFHLNKSIFITYMHASFNKSFTSLYFYIFYEQ